MNELFDQFFDFAFYGAIVWLVIVIFVSILYRARKARQFPSIPEGTVQFREKWVSGRSLKNLFTRFGGASNVLNVMVGRGYLVIRPVFPFNLMFIPEFTDLEHVVPIARIIEVKEIQSLGKEGIIIRFQNESRRESEVELYLRNPESFLEAVGNGAST
jgi:hypothetical protein